VRDADGTIYVLEDNLRVPSGVSYMLENRLVTKRVFPELFEHYAPLPVDDYPSQLFDTLASLSPRPAEYPEVVVLTPGIYNSAYFEHAYLAQQMGAELVEGRDLFVDSDDCCYMRTVDGPARVDVIYRRVDDLFLDPEAFRPDSALGVPACMRAWKAGNVALANAPGAGVADDKVVYAFVPGDHQVLPGPRAHHPERADLSLHGAGCAAVRARAHGRAGGEAGQRIRRLRHAGGAGLDPGRARPNGRCIKKDPRNYIAQPTLKLSTVPTVIKDRLEPRHVDLRPSSCPPTASR
jgi:uncharacterized circularly permuted ATP-grasp superfamily protein